MTVLAWSPLRSGWLTGKYLPENKGEGGGEARLNAEMMKDWVSVDEAGLRTIREVVAMAKELGVTAAQVALAWLRHRSVAVI